MKKILFLIVLMSLLLAGVNAYALTAGQSYTISLDKVNSDGTTSALGISTTATADSDGRISFTLSGVPDNTACNFMVVKVTNNTTGLVERKSVTPCATSGTTLPLGVSNVTANQADALLNAFQSAGSDDPILAVFGLAIVRTTGITASELPVIAGIAKNAVMNPGGFLDHLTVARSVTAAQIAAYRSSIVSQLADPNSGYSKLIKDSVDAATASSDAGKRGEAASVLLGILVKAATSAGFPQDYIMESFDAMGTIAVPAIQSAVGAGTLSANTAQAINSSIGGGMRKLKANRVVEKYTGALSTLGASGDDVTQFQTAASTLVTAMNSAFSTFEQSAFAAGDENSAAISAAQTALDDAIQTAFNNFISSVAVSDSRIAAMISNINTALGSNSGLAPGYFKFYSDASHSYNWPVSMVVLTDWISRIKMAGGNLTFTRDTLTIPASITWMGSCSNAGFYDQASCNASGGGTGVWTPARTDFVGQGIPVLYAHLFEIEEDITIRQFKREEDIASAGDDMSAQGNAEKAFTDGLFTTIAAKISGAKDSNGTPISDAEKEAIIMLMQTPQM